ncbi:uncharacterized protein CBL_10578 [Carabus blaptoides fortunei]
MSVNPVSVLNVTECQQILDNSFQSTPVTYVSHTARSLSGDVEGYLSEHYSLEITYSEDGQSDTTHTKKFFVKCLLSHNGFMAEFTRAMDVFNREAFLYTHLFRQFEKLNVYKQIAPEFCLAKENMLVLEDLSVKGYKAAHRMNNFTMEQCKVALETIAYFHAYSIIHEELKSKETGTKYRLNIVFPDEFEEKFYSGIEDSPTTKFIASSIQCLLDIIDELPEDRVNKDELKRLLKEDKAGESDLEQDTERYRFTCVHGDLWANNIMFKHNETGHLEGCQLVDFQMIRYCLPAFDVELFFYGNTTAEFRRQHKEELLHYYYNRLGEALEKNGLNIKELLPFAELQDTSKLKAPEAKIQAISDTSLLYLPEEILQQGMTMPDFFKTLLIDERSKYILNLYHENEEFRNLIIEELVDLQELLEAKKTFIYTAS